MFLYVKSIIADVALISKTIFFFSEPTDMKHTNRPFVENKKKSSNSGLKVVTWLRSDVRLMFLSQMGKVPSSLNLDTRVYLSG